ncbi:subtilase-type protease inhibitor [Streptomyces sp. NPDC002004]
MPKAARWAAALTLVAAAASGPLSGTANAAPHPGPAALYAPSSLVLTVGHGETAASATPERAVTLTCSPTASGTHPAAKDACAELIGVNGDLDALATGSGGLCTRQYAPVVVTVQGVWRGTRVTYERTFANDCIKDSFNSVLYSF